MSRLIDADKLIEDMKNELEKAVNDENMDKADCLVIMTAAIALKDFVNRQPTAYDVDKVVEQLECAEGTVCGHKDITNDCGGCAGCTECDMEDAYRYALEIVKAGGIGEKSL